LGPLVAVEVSASINVDRCLDNYRSGSCTYPLQLNGAQLIPLTEMKYIILNNYYGCHITAKLTSTKIKVWAEDITNRDDINNEGGRFCLVRHRSHIESMVIKSTFFKIKN